MGRIMVFRMVVFVRKQVELGALHGIKLLSLILTMCKGKTETQSRRPLDVALIQ